MMGEIFSMRIELSYLLPYDWPHGKRLERALAFGGS
jgi:hypothetical protein